MCKRLLLVFLSFFSILAISNAQTFQLWGLISAYGPNNGYGSIFKINPDGTGFDTIHTFHDYNYDSDGFNPYGSLIQASNGKLYGMTDLGGDTSVSYDGGRGAGIIFSVDPTTDQYTIVKTFHGDDGAFPNGNLLQANDGLLYGMTSGGADSFITYDQGKGVLFSFNPINNIYTVLRKFNMKTGSSPLGTLIQLDDGKLYGMTYEGGIGSQAAGSGGGSGVIFSYDPDSAIYKVLYDFGDTSSVGANPIGNLIKASDGNLYGMTEEYNSNYAGGIIFSFNVPTKTLTDVHDFNYPNGNAPWGSLIQVGDSLLYGMTTGGSSGLNIKDGNIFSYNIYTNTYSSLYSIKNDTMGETPFGDLLQAPDGKLYGMMGYGGDFSFFPDGGNGVVFSFDPTTNIYSDIFNFNADTAGAWPYGNLIALKNTSTSVLSLSNNQLSIYPNPATGQFTINIPRNQHGYTVEIINVLGQTVMKSLLDATKTINLSSQPSGMYFIYVKSDEGVEVGKVLVTK